MPLLGARATLSPFRGYLNTTRSAGGFFILKAKGLLLLNAHILSDSQDGEIPIIRQIAMFVSRELTGCSYPVIGTNFGGRSHTLVIQACEETWKWLENDSEIVEVVSSIINELKLS